MQFDLNERDVHSAKGALKLASTYAQMTAPTDQAKFALDLLIEAREIFKHIDNKQTVKRVQLAVSSARGAVRIQQYRATREDIISRPWGDE